MHERTAPQPGAAPVRQCSQPYITACERDVSPSRQQLIKLMRSIGYGRIENLSLSFGEPDFKMSPPKIIRKIKIRGDNDPRPEPVSWLAPLKAELVEMMSHLDRITLGVIRCIEVKGGLPFTIEIEEFYRP